MDNPFRAKFYQDSLKQSNKLTHNEFSQSIHDANGTYVKLDEINNMIEKGILTVDYEKLEQRIYDRTISL